MNNLYSEPLYMFKKYRQREFTYQIYPNFIRVWASDESYYNGVIYSGYTVNEAIKAHYERIKK